VGSELGIIGTFGMSQVPLAITEELAGEGVDPVAEIPSILPCIQLCPSLGGRAELEVEFVSVTHRLKSCVGFHLVILLNSPRPT